MSIVEQRYQAVLAVLAGDPVVDVAVKVGVSRQSVHTWLRRYADARGSPGRAWLFDPQARIARVRGSSSREDARTVRVRAWLRRVCFVVVSCAKCVVYLPIT